MVRRGFTLIELLISIAIGAALVAVVIGAAQQVRETSRRVSCQNNLHQIGVAISNYEVLHRVFPAAANEGSLFVTLLPHLGEEPLYKAFRAANASDPEAYRTFAERHPAPPVYICPSDSAPNFALNAEVRSFSTNYAGNFGTGVQAHGFNGVIQRVSGMPYPKRFPEGYVRAADVRDGLTQTAAVSEILHGTGAVERHRTLWQTPEPLLAPDELDTFAGVCHGIPPFPTSYGWRGDSSHLGIPWSHGEVARTLYNHVLGPNSPSCSNAGFIQFSIVSTNSEHSSLVNVLFADGRVQGIADSIDLKAWRDMGSRSNAILMHADQ